jgi:hypothetical protein
LHQENTEKIGRAKVIGSQFNRNKRIKLYQLQDISHSSSHVFSQIDPMLLTNALALVAKHGRNDFFHMMLATCPALMSLCRHKQGT